MHRGLGASSPGKRRTGPRWGGAPGKVQESSAPEFRGGGGSRQARELVGRGWGWTVRGEDTDAGDAWLWVASAPWPTSLSRLF